MSDVQNMNTPVSRGTREVIPFTTDHYVVATAGMHPWQDAEAAGRLYETRGPAYSGFVDGELAVCAGVVILYPGLGEAWAVVTDLGRRHPLFVTRAVRRGLQQIIRDHRLRRVQADVVTAHTPALEWARAFGFRDESTMPLYGPHGEGFTRLAMFPPVPDRYERVDGLLHLHTGRGEFILDAETQRRLPVIAGGTGAEPALILAIVGAVAAVAGTGVAVYSAYQQSEAQAQAAKYNRQAALNEAAQAEDAAKAEANQQREQYRRIIGANRAAVGASGVEETGSPLLVMADNAAQAELNARMTEYAGQVRGTSARTQAELYRVTGANARTAGALSMAGTALTGAANLADRGYGYYRTSPRTVQGATSSNVLSPGGWTVGSGGYY